MNYFDAISKRAAELDAIGQGYLDKLPFMSNGDVIKRLFEIAFEIDRSDQENPEWVDEAIDGFLPYSRVPKNGSIYFSLGWACTANDACLRNMLEVAEGRETDTLNLMTLAEKEIVESYCTT